KSVASLAKEEEQAYYAQRSRLESSFLLVRAMPIAHWPQHFIEHPLHGLLGRTLIWVVTVCVGCQGEDSVRRGRVVHKQSGFWTDVMFLVFVQGVGWPVAVYLVLMSGQPSNPPLELAIIGGNLGLLQGECD